jgi:hypothetical protein
MEPILEAADPEVLRGHGILLTPDATLPEPGKGAHQFCRKTPQLTSGSERKFRLEPASMVGEIDHPRGTIMPSGMKGNAPPVVGDMAHVGLGIAKPERERTRIVTANSRRIEIQ